MTAQELAGQQLRPTGPGTAIAALDLALAAASEPIPALAGASRWWVAGVRGAIEVRTVPGNHLPIAVQRLTHLAAAPALLAVRLAVAVSGRRPFTALLPDPTRPGVLALVRHGAVAPPTQAEQALFAALVRARPPESAPGPAVRSVLPLLRRAAETEGAWSRSVSEADERADLIALLGVVPDAPPDGLLMVIGSHQLHRAGGLHAGQAMQRVLPTARSAGLDAAVLTGPSKLVTLRRADVPGAGPGLVPQVVLAIGQGTHEGSDRSGPIRA